MGNEKPVVFILWRFTSYHGRMGCLTGLLVATEESVEKGLGRVCDFGEALGKHSHIQVTLTRDHFTKLTDEQEFIQKVIGYGLVPNGYNPFAYMEQDTDAEQEAHHG